MDRKKIAILGTRGIPAAHGGFETFAQALAPYLVDRGWDVLVYCQTEGRGAFRGHEWKGVRLLDVPVVQGGALGTIVYDWKTVRHVAAEEPDRLVLTLGYNTALFNLRFRMKKMPNVINMDGIEWRRRKWKPHERAWLYLNERMGCLIGHRLVADHPEIENHLATRVSRDKITMIPYGAPEVTTGDEGVLENLGVEPGKYLLLIARPEPENSILEIVTAFSAGQRGVKLLILGNYDGVRNAYHRQVMDAASDEVIFAGAIFDPPVVSSLRHFCLLYVHGHTVGGTNPSLVEALGASSPVLAHDNKYNRWVAGAAGEYFSDAGDCARSITRLLGDSQKLARMRAESRRRFIECFTWEHILQQYEALLASCL